MPFGPILAGFPGGFMDAQRQMQEQEAQRQRLQMMQAEAQRQQQEWQLKMQALGGAGRIMGGLGQAGPAGLPQQGQQPPQQPQQMPMPPVAASPGQTPIRPAGMTMGEPTGQTATAAVRPGSPQLEEEQLAGQPPAGAGQAGGGQVAGMTGQQPMAPMVATTEEQRKDGMRAQPGQTDLGTTQHLTLQRILQEADRQMPGASPLQKMMAIDHLMPYLKQEEATALKEAQNELKRSDMARKYDEFRMKEYRLQVQGDEKLRQASDRITDLRAHRASQDQIAAAEHERKMIETQNKFELGQAKQATADFVAQNKAELGEKRIEATRERTEAVKEVGKLRVSTQAETARKLEAGRMERFQQKETRMGEQFKALQADRDRRFTLARQRYAPDTQTQIQKAEQQGWDAPALQRAVDYYRTTGGGILPDINRLDANNRTAVLTAMQAMMKEQGIVIGGTELTQNKRVFDAQNAAAKKWFDPGSQVGQAARSLSVVQDHLETLRQLVNVYDPSNMTAFNKIRAAFLRATGSDVGTNLEMASHIVGTEIIKAMGVRGAGTAEERNQAAQAFGPGMPQARGMIDLAYNLIGGAGGASGPQLYGAIETAQKLLGGQLKGLEDQYNFQTGLGGKAPFKTMLSPIAQEEMERIKAGRPPPERPEQFRRYKDIGTYGHPFSGGRGGTMELPKPNYE